MTTAADSDGLHLLVADSDTGYTWRTVTVLSEPQLPADTWIGNQCVMDDHHAAVAYAPRTFANKPDLMMGGAFTAIVNLDDGSVTKLPFTASLAYFDPTCSPDTHTAVFTALRDAETRLVTVNVKGSTIADTTANGEITSAVPTKDGVIAAAGNQLVHVDHMGRTAKLAATRHAPYGIRVTSDGTIGYIDRTGDTDADVQTYARGKKTIVASGKLAAMSLHQGTDGTVYLIGRADRGTNFAASGIKALNVPPDAEVSNRGRLAVNPVLSPAVQSGVDNIENAGRGFTRSTTNEPAAETTTGHTSHALTITGTVPGTGEHTDQKVAEPGSTAGGRPSPALTGSSRPQKSKISVPTAAADSRANDPVDTDRWCSVPRNDVGTQALQPTPNQVEWAVDMAVQGNLRSGYLAQGGWRSQTGLSTIDPQGLFPKPKLTGDGRIPAQVELGILAQESNLWQAESGAIPGQTGSPLAAVDGFYGHETGGSVSDFWTIHWEKSDCGYGVGQVTDGMRKAGYEKPNERVLPVSTQRAVAIDYTTNIAASLYILADKWNEVHEPGQTITVNNDDPAKPENWFTAVWNYNLGFNAKADAGSNGNWGLGWYNNPANPVYPASRMPFMNTDLDPLANADAAHPQNWPYEEKVMGWAAWSIDTGHSYATSGRQDWPGESGFSSAGFRPAYWNGTNGTVLDQSSAKYHRAQATPPLDAFCNTKNNCDTAHPPDCPDPDCYKQYWWHESNTTWKSDCAASCGFENIKYQTLVSEPGRGTRLQYGAPTCSGAPSGAKVVESVPAGTNTWSNCGTTATDGSFQFAFYPDPYATGPGLGQYEAKADLHQIGGGYGGHFWYAHVRDADHLGGDRGRMTVDGTWTLGQSMDVAHVWVHVPDTGAQTKHAHYVIRGALGGPYDRYVDQADNNGKWVSLGAYKFTSTPSATLSNDTPDGAADQDIAYGAVAFQPVNGTYVSDTVEADAFFDEDQDIDVRPESLLFNTPLKSRQALYDWATNLSQNIVNLPTCIDLPSPTCVMPETKAAAERWNAEVKTSGTSTTGHPDGHSIPAWMHYSNAYTKRPSNDTRPSWFGTDDAAYKMYNKATVSYVKTSDGKIVSGSQSVTYDSRTADTHIPDFVREFIAAVKTDYGTAPPNLNYSTKDLNVHDGKTVTTTTNSDGILPGRAYQSIGMKPVTTDVDDNVVTDGSGTCVAVMHTAGGSIGYRTALADKELTDSVADWVDRVADDTGSSGGPVASMAQEIRNMFFKPGLTGSIFVQAPPIWQELYFKTCTDGTVKRVGGAPVLRSSYMPNQYLYRNDKAVDLNGDDTGSDQPVTTGDFYHFSGLTVPPFADDPYGNCSTGADHSGNPWGILVYAGPVEPEIDPTNTHFCNAPGKTPDPEYTE
ncbi:Tat pathway signal protein [Streptomyces sp. NPDC046985]|uniref:Tat pathway signal protein n=1 Tax=Streptomyces sp. NPDC046985 TaxID=3155377 RepID=UPI0033E0EB00